MESRLQDNTAANSEQIEKLRIEVMQGMQQKPEFQDLEAMAHKIHTKADFVKVQELVSALKQEVVSQITEIKKEAKKKAQKKKTDLDKSKQEQEFANDKIYQEVRASKDKLTKLANQFDKELLDRDKSLKQYQVSLWDDIQQLITSI